MRTFHIKVKDKDQDRLDSFVAEKLSEFSRSFIKKLIEDKLVLVNNKQMKSSYIVKIGDLIEINIPERKKIIATPENIPLNIIYEDKDIVIVNKPQGMVVHPGVDNNSGTLVNALLYHIDNLSSINKDIRPGIVHRIDKDTSGILLVAKNNKAHKFLPSTIWTSLVMLIVSRIHYNKILIPSIFFSIVTVICLLYSMFFSSNINGSQRVKIGRASCRERG